MCSVKTPKPVEIEKPVFVRNPFLDEDDQDVRNASALRRGRSSLVIPTGDGIGFVGRGSRSGATSGGPNNNNGRRPGNRSNDGGGTYVGANTGPGPNGPGNGGPGNRR